MKDDRFLSLFLQHERSLAAFARTMLPDWESVDDVIQNASVAMWRKIDTLDNDDEFMRWAIVVVRMEALKYRRSKARDRLVLSDELVDRLTSEAQEENDPSHVAAYASAFDQCLKSFAPEHQKLLLSPYVSHGSVKELAKSIGSTANALYKKIGRLRVKLHDCVETRLQTERGSA